MEKVEEAIKIGKKVYVNTELNALDISLKACAEYAYNKGRQDEREEITKLLEKYLPDHVLIGKIKGLGSEKRCEK